MLLFKRTSVNKLYRNYNRINIKNNNRFQKPSTIVVSKRLFFKFRSRKRMITPPTEAEIAARKKKELEKRERREREIRQFKERIKWDKLSVFAKFRIYAQMFKATSMRALRKFYYRRIRGWLFSPELTFQFPIDHDWYVEMELWYGTEDQLQLGPYRRWKRQNRRFAFDRYQTEDALRLWLTNDPAFDSIEDETSRMILEDYNYITTSYKYFVYNVQPLYVAFTFKNKQPPQAIESVISTMKDNVTRKYNVEPTPENILHYSLGDVVFSYRSRLYSHNVFELSADYTVFRHLLKNKIFSMSWFKSREELFLKYIEIPYIQDMYARQAQERRFEQRDKEGTVLDDDYHSSLDTLSLGVINESKLQRYSRLLHAKWHYQKKEWSFNYYYDRLWKFGRTGFYFHNLPKNLFDVPFDVWRYAYYNTPQFIIKYTKLRDYETLMYDEERSIFGIPYTPHICINPVHPMWIYGIVNAGLHPLDFDEFEHTLATGESYHATNSTLDSQRLRTYTWNKFFSDLLLEPYHVREFPYLIAGSIVVLVGTFPLFYPPIFPFFQKDFFKEYLGAHSWGLFHCNWEYRPNLKIPQNGLLDNVNPFTENYKWLHRYYYHGWRARYGEPLPRKRSVVQRIKSFVNYVIDVELLDRKSERQKLLEYARIPWRRKHRNFASRVSAYDKINSGLPRLLRPFPSTLPSLSGYIETPQRFIKKTNDILLLYQNRNSLGIHKPEDVEIFYKDCSMPDYQRFLEEMQFYSNPSEFGSDFVNQLGFQILRPVFSTYEDFQMWCLQHKLGLFEMNTWVSPEMQMLIGALIPTMSFFRSHDGRRRRKRLFYKRRFQFTYMDKLHDAAGILPYVQYFIKNPYKRKKKAHERIKRQLFDLSNKPNFDDSIPQLVKTDLKFLGLLFQHYILSIDRSAEIRNLMENEIEKLRLVDLKEKQWHLWNRMWRKSPYWFDKQLEPRIFNKHKKNFKRILKKELKQLFHYMLIKNKYKNNSRDDQSNANPAIKTYLGFLKGSILYRKLKRNLKTIIDPLNHVRFISSPVSAYIYNRYSLHRSWKKALRRGKYRYHYHLPYNDRAKYLYWGNVRFAPVFELDKDHFLRSFMKIRFVKKRLRRRRRRVWEQLLSNRFLSRAFSLKHKKYPKSTIRQNKYVSYAQYTPRDVRLKRRHLCFQPRFMRLRSKWADRRSYYGRLLLPRSNRAYRAQNDSELDVSTDLANRRSEMPYTYSARYTLPMRPSSFALSLSLNGIQAASGPNTFSAKGLRIHHLPKFKFPKRSNFKSKKAWEDELKKLRKEHLASINSYRKSEVYNRAKYPVVRPHYWSLFLRRNQRHFKRQLRIRQKYRNYIYKNITIDPNSEEIPDLPDLPDLPQFMDNYTSRIFYSNLMMPRREPTKIFRDYDDWPEDLSYLSIKKPLFYHRLKKNHILDSKEWGVHLGLRRRRKTVKTPSHRSMIVSQYPLFLSSRKRSARLNINKYAKKRKVASALRHARNWHFILWSEDIIPRARLLNFLLRKPERIEGYQNITPIQDLYGFKNYWFRKAAFRGHRKRHSHNSLKLNPFGAGLGLQRFNYKLFSRRKFVKKLFTLAAYKVRRRKPHRLHSKWNVILRKVSYPRPNQKVASRIKTRVEMTTNPKRFIRYRQIYRALRNNTKEKPSDKPRRIKRTFWGRKVKVITHLHKAFARKRSRIYRKSLQLTFPSVYSHNQPKFLNRLLNYQNRNFYQPLGSTPSTISDATVRTPSPLQFYARKLNADFVTLKDVRIPRDDLLSPWQQVKVFKPRKRIMSVQGPKRKYYLRSVTRLLRSNIIHKLPLHQIMKDPGLKNWLRKRSRYWRVTSRAAMVSRYYKKYPFGREYPLYASQGLKDHALLPQIHPDLRQRKILENAYLAAEYTLVNNHKLPSKVWFMPQKRRKKRALLKSHKGFFPETTFEKLYDYDNMITKRRYLRPYKGSRYAKAHQALAKKIVPFKKPFFPFESWLFLKRSRSIRNRPFFLSSGSVQSPTDIQQYLSDSIGYSRSRRIIDRAKRKPPKSGQYRLSFNSEEQPPMAHFSPFFSDPYMKFRLTRILNSKNSIHALLRSLGRHDGLRRNLAKHKFFLHYLRKHKIDMFRWRHRKPLYTIQARLLSFKRNYFVHFNRYRWGPSREERADMRRLNADWVPPKRPIYGKYPGIEFNVIKDLSLQDLTSKNKTAKGIAFQKLMKRIFKYSKKLKSHHRGVKKLYLSPKSKRKKYKTMINILTDVNDATIGKRRRNRLKYKWFKKWHSRLNKRRLKRSYFGHKRVPKQRINKHLFNAQARFFSQRSGLRRYYGRFKQRPKNRKRSRLLSSLKFMKRLGIRVGRRLLGIRRKRRPFKIKYLWRKYYRGSLSWYNLAPYEKSRKKNAADLKANDRIKKCNNILRRSHFSTQRVPGSRLHSRALRLLEYLKAKPIENSWYSQMRFSRLGIVAQRLPKTRIQDVFFDQSKQLRKNKDYNPNFWGLIKHNTSIYNRRYRPFSNEIFLARNNFLLSRLLDPLSQTYFRTPSTGSLYSNKNDFFNRFEWNTYFRGDQLSTYPRMPYIRQIKKLSELYGPKFNAVSFDPEKTREFHYLDNEHYGANRRYLPLQMRWPRQVLYGYYANSEYPRLEGDKEHIAKIQRVPFFIKKFLKRHQVKIPLDWDLNPDQVKLVKRGRKSLHMGIRRFLRGVSFGYSRFNRYPEGAEIQRRYLKYRALRRRRRQRRRNPHYLSRLVRGRTLVRRFSSQFDRKIPYPPPYRYKKLKYYYPKLNIKFRLPKPPKSTFRRYEWEKYVVSFKDYWRINLKQRVKQVAWTSKEWVAREKHWRRARAKRLAKILWPSRKILRKWRRYGKIQRLYDKFAKSEKIYNPYVRPDLLTKPQPLKPPRQFFKYKYSREPYYYLIGVRDRFYRVPRKLLKRRKIWKLYSYKLWRKYGRPLKVYTGMSIRSLNKKFKRRGYITFLRSKKNPEYEKLRYTKENQKLRRSLWLHAYNYGKRLHRLERIQPRKTYIKGPLIKPKRTKKPRWWFPVIVRRELWPLRVHFTKRKRNFKYDRPRTPYESEMIWKRELIRRRFDRRMARIIKQFKENAPEIERHEWLMNRGGYYPKPIDYQNYYRQKAFNLKFEPIIKTYNKYGRLSKYVPNPRFIPNKDVPFTHSSGEYVASRIKKAYRGMGTANYNQMLNSLLSHTYNPDSYKGTLTHAFNSMWRSSRVMGIRRPMVLGYNHRTNSGLADRYHNLRMNRFTYMRIHDREIPNPLIIPDGTYDRISRTALVNANIFDKFRWLYGSLELDASNPFYRHMLASRRRVMRALYRRLQSTNYKSIIPQEYRKTNIGHLNYLDRFNWKNLSPSTIYRSRIAPVYWNNNWKVKYSRPNYSNSTMFDNWPSGQYIYLWGSKKEKSNYHRLYSGLIRSHLLNRDMSYLSYGRHIFQRPKMLDHVNSSYMVYKKKVSKLLKPYLKNNYKKRSNYTLKRLVDGILAAPESWLGPDDRAFFHKYWKVDLLKENGLNEEHVYGYPRRKSKLLLRNRLRNIDNWLTNYVLNEQRILSKLRVTRRPKRRRAYYKKRIHFKDVLDYWKKHYGQSLSGASSLRSWRIPTLTLQKYRDSLNLHKRRHLYEMNLRSRYAKGFYDDLVQPLRQPFRLNITRRKQSNSKNLLDRFF
uniref:Uncharacterized protein n=1 Tax=Eukaryota sp. BB2 TaxID=1949062 RepID=A0A1W7AF28_9EUKA|nr:hypothetical protein CCM08_mgp16 [Eukaryota sp. BB2]ARQ20677.1 hypothetical protein [Eukaryota sp. BB2]